MPSQGLKSGIMFDAIEPALKRREDSLTKAKRIGQKWEQPAFNSIFY